MPLRDRISNMQLFPFVLISLCIGLSENSPVILDIKDAEDELIAVITISRHGDRAPVSSFPKDIFFNEAYWPMGLGQLTKNGINRHYKLGKWLRQRYNNFLGDIYNPSEFYACSTHTDRTLMSASVNLAGLFPPKEFQIWNEHIPWQPIPIHFADFISLIETRGCPKYYKLLKETKNVVYKSFHEKSPELLEFVANNTGWNTVTLDEIEFLEDVFSTYRENNVSFLPDWEANLDKNLTKYLAGVVYEVQSHTIPLARLRIGTFYEKVINFFEIFVNHSAATTSKQKFLMITAHESTLTAVLNAIEAFRMRIIHYADTIIFELKKSEISGYYINVLYKTKENLVKLKIKNCKFNCKFEEFKSEMFNITTNQKQWNEECENLQKFPQTPTNVIIKR